jgi:hypothetical protein
MTARTTLLFLLMMPVSAAMAQCTFTPTITPDDLILCPDESATLSTQVYDSYQWYKDGNLITGATGQTLAVEQFNDAGSSFTVSATLDACTEMSASVLVDGWAFLFPYVIHGGDEPNSTGPNGEEVFCEGDTLTLTLGAGYTENIVWTNNGVPIPDETSPTLTVTTSGLYTVSAAPDVCPNSVMGIGVDISVTFNAPIQPDIIPNGDQLCAYPTGNSTQWYLGGEPIATTDCITMTSSGPYTVFVDYGNDCQIISEPFMTTGISESDAHRFSIAPMPAQTAVNITWPSALQPQGMWHLLDMTGRIARSGEFRSDGGMSLDVSTLEAGNYLFVPTTDKAWEPVRVVVAH